MRKASLFAYKPIVNDNNTIQKKNQVESKDKTNNNVPLSSAKKNEKKVVNDENKSLNSLNKTYSVNKAINTPNKKSTKPIVLSKINKSSTVKSLSKSTVTKPVDNNVVSPMLVVPRRQILRDLAEPTRNDSNKASNPFENVVNKEISNDNEEKDIDVSEIVTNILDTMLDDNEIKPETYRRLSMERYTFERASLLKDNKEDNIDTSVVFEALRTYINILDMDMSEFDTKADFNSIDVVNDINNADSKSDSEINSPLNEEVNELVETVYPTGINELVVDTTLESNTDQTFTVNETKPLESLDSLDNSNNEKANAIEDSATLVPIATNKKRRNRRSTLSFKQTDMINYEGKPLAIVPALEVAVETINSNTGRVSEIRLSMLATPFTDMLDVALSNGFITVQILDHVDLSDHVAYQIRLKIFESNDSTRSPDMEMTLLRRYSQFDNINQSLLQSINLLPNNLSKKLSSLISKQLSAFPLAHHNCYSIWRFCYESNTFLSNRKELLEKWLMSLLNTHRQIVDIIHENDNDKLSLYEDTLKSFLTL